MQKKSHSNELKNRRGDGEEGKKKDGPWDDINRPKIS